MFSGQDFFHRGYNKNIFNLFSHSLAVIMNQGILKDILAISSLLSIVYCHNSKRLVKILGKVAHNH